MAFRRINNNLLGETLVSEFVQDALADKESNSKSSKGSSHENLINLENNESPLPEIRAQQTRRQEIPDVPFRVTRPHGDIREIDPSIEASDGIQDEYELIILNRGYAQEFRLASFIKEEKSADTSTSIINSLKVECEVNRSDLMS